MFQYAQSIQFSTKTTKTLAFIKRFSREDPVAARKGTRRLSCASPFRLFVSSSRRLFSHQQLCDPDAQGWEKATTYKTHLSHLDLRAFRQQFWICNHIRNSFDLDIRRFADFARSVFLCQINLLSHSILLPLSGIESLRRGREKNEKHKAKSFSSQPFPCSPGGAAT